MSDTRAPADQLTPVEGIRRELRRTIGSYIIGHNERGSSRSALAEDSWFGPDSVTWLVQSDWSILVGAIQSLLIQTLHPPTMAGVAEHSNFKDDPFGRIHRTANFVGITTYGSAQDAERMVRTIRKIHKRVVGVTPDGVPYEANDPHNLAWVHCTEVDAFLRSYQRYGNVSISSAEADQYVEEMARVGEALGVVDAPRSVSELDARLRSYIPELKFNAQARESVRWLTFMPNAPAARAPYTVIFGAAVNLLPNWARRKMWLPPSIPFVSDAMVAPSAKVLLKTLDWIMQPPPEIAEVRARRAA